MTDPAATATEPGGAHSYVVRSSVERFAGPVFTVVSDEVTMPDGSVVRRDYLRHPGSVGVVALDSAGRVALLRQYRHALRARIWELPAGLLDVAGESPAVAARRELAEEADLAAGRLDVLVDLHVSPGMSDELIRIFLARDLSPAESRHQRRFEEAEITVVWRDLDAAVRMATTGEITNGPAVAGLLATAHARDHGWAGLRPADAPLPG